MTRRQAQLWTVWLLPLLVVRLLLPSGVMPAHGAHGASLVMCRAQFGAPLLPASSGGHTDPTHADHSCPFFAAAALAAPTTQLSALSPLLLVVAVALLALRRINPSGPIRSQRSRAPPISLL